LRRIAETILKVVFQSIQAPHRCHLNGFSVSVQVAFPRSRYTPAIRWLNDYARRVVSCRGSVQI
jgi:hypothetical protein